MALAYYVRKIQTTPGNPQHVKNMIGQLLWVASNLLYITITYTHFGLSQVVWYDFVQSLFRFSRDLATLHNAAQTTRVFLNLAIASFLQKVAVYGILFAVHISLFWAMYLSWVQYVLGAWDSTGMSYAEEFNEWITRSFSLWIVISFCLMLAPPMFPYF
jgi:hypothetical protein